MSKLVQIRAGDLLRFKGKVSDELWSWCEIVLANNQPGQKLWTEALQIEALEKEAEDS